MCNRFKDAMGKEVVLEILPDVFCPVKLRGIGRYSQERDIAWNS
jgi:hypothetical protein